MKLEHINLRVPSIAKTQTFLHSAFPDFHERGSGYNATYGYWSHFGNDTTYIALLQGEKPGEETEQCISPYHYSDPYRLMHTAYEVNDINELITRLRLQGFEPSITDDLHSHPHRRRVYYLDGNGIEWEFIEYLSNQIDKRNDYSL